MNSKHTIVPGSVDAALPDMNESSLILLTGAFLSAPLHAGPRTSASYAVPTDSLDASGRRTASATYTNDGSLGGITGLSTVAAPAETLKAGYIAQLYDITGLTLTPAGASLSETGSLQLGAQFVLDDATLLAVPATNVTWSVLSGPLTGISLSGLATADIAYQDTAASVQGIHFGYTTMLGLIVTDKFHDNFGAYAGDNMADDWQVQYFGLNNPVAGSAFDPDGDGFDNLFEYNACLVPTDPLSVLSINIANTTGGGHSVTFSPRFDACTYSLLGSGDLSLWAPVTGTVSDNGTLRTILDPAGTGLRRFYRLDVQRQ